MDYVASLQRNIECLENLEGELKTDLKAPDSCFYIRAALYNLTKAALSLPQELKSYNLAHSERGVPREVDKLYMKATRNLVALKEALLEKLKDERTPSIVCLVEALTTLEESNEALTQDLKAQKEERRQSFLPFHDNIEEGA